MIIFSNSLNLHALPFSGCEFRVLAQLLMCQEPRLVFKHGIYYLALKIPGFRLLLEGGV